MSAPDGIYSDGSGFESYIRALAILYIKDCFVKILWYYIPQHNKEHTVSEAEGVGLTMGLHLLKGLNIKLTHPTILGSDSQVAIKALHNQ